MRSKVLYEKEYKKAGHFSFGQNWRDFLTSLTSERVKVAEQSLETFLGGKKNIKNKAFIDIGCGSGIFSLAAYRLGAKEVMSVDIDDASLKCVQFLREKEKSPKNWKIKKGSALNQSLLKTFGQFDIVYSWGVLHHTGDMYSAITNVARLVNPTGKLYVAIYNKYEGGIHGKSAFWLRVKRHYNKSNRFIKQIYVWVYSSYLFLGLCLTGKNPFHYIQDYQGMRGMSWTHDILDWLGGYPYEYATPAKIKSYLSDLGFTLQNITLVNTIGCNEYLFTRNKPLKELPKVTALISVHNSAKTLDHALKSIFDQTFQPSVICINDASTDTTSKILKKWQKKMGSNLRVIVNDKNLGLTKSLNKGLKYIDTPYTARIDADDWWESTKLEKQINFLEANPQYGVIGSWYTNHTHRKKYFLHPPMSDEAIRSMIMKRNPFAHSCVVYKTKLIRDLGGYDETARYGQDYDLWLHCLPETRFFNLPQTLCHRSFTGGISVEKQQEQMRQGIKTRLKYIHNYRLPVSNYLYIIEPWLISLTPRWLADLKRKLNDRYQVLI
jgi:glycosyltransferase involved in cell wall biosynthesis/2-polyprenyl-3-methyl-5-hydroxy-6-metoxy-1,4-benzoquinol methylase